METRVQAVEQKGLSLEDYRDLYCNEIHIACHSFILYSTAMDVFIWDNGIEGSSADDMMLNSNFLSHGRASSDRRGPACSWLW